MAMMTIKTEPYTLPLAFSTKPTPMNLNKSMSLNEVIREMERTRFGGTDCALPMLWALENKAEVDLFVVYTDSETWYGKIHPVQALQMYREQMGIPAKLAVVGMLANKFSIADPNDPGMLDFVGFDTSVPQALAEFAKM
jgi:60 kDa SS-A/Ro ribonucleoprotein